MPLARQTSRIVWPSVPSTIRPSTSSRNAGVRSGRCGAWAVISFSARASRRAGRRCRTAPSRPGAASMRPALRFHTACWRVGGPEAPGEGVLGAVAGIAGPARPPGRSGCGGTAAVGSAGRQGRRRFVACRQRLRPPRWAVTWGGGGGLMVGMGRLRTRLRPGHRPLDGRSRPGSCCGGCGRRARRGSTGRRSGARAWRAARGRTARSSTMSAARSVSRVISSPRGSPSQMRAPISARRRRPIRHGIVLPQASSAQKRVRAAARSTTQLPAGPRPRSSRSRCARRPSRGDSWSYGNGQGLRRQECRPTGRRRAAP